MKDVSIEYAHIYTDKHINEEHEFSLEILAELKGQNDWNSSLVVMIDDYSFPDPTFDYAGFVDWLSDKGFKPDVVFRESQLIPLCDEVLKLVSNSKLKEQLADYIRTKKYPCSLFIAAWYLLRLGHLKYALFDEAEVATKLINILPISFKPFEEKAIEIINSTSYSKATENIENRYFEGRLIA